MIRAGIVVGLQTKAPEPLPAHFLCKQNQANAYSSLLPSGLQHVGQIAAAMLVAMGYALLIGPAFSQWSHTRLTRGNLCHAVLSPTSQSNTEYVTKNPAVWHSLLFAVQTLP